MAIVGTHHTSGGDTTAATEYTAASITPTANRLQLAVVGNQDDGSATPSVVSITGNGLTWVVVRTRTFETGAANRFRLTVLRALGASPSAGTPVISVAAGTGDQTGCLWTFDEFSGVDTGGANGADAVRQSDSDFTNVNVTTGTGGTLAAFADAVNNVAYGALSTRNNDLLNVDEAGYTELGQVAIASSSQNLSSHYKVGEDTVVTFTFSNNEFGAISIEIVAAAAAGISIPVVYHHRQRNF